MPFALRDASRSIRTYCQFNAIWKDTDRDSGGPKTVQPTWRLPGVCCRKN